MRKVHITCLTVTVLRHHHHSQTLRRILAYRFCLDARQRRAVKQHHHVRVLLDSPAFTQVAQDRTAERPSVASPVQLAQEQNGHIQFFCHEFRLTGGLRHFLFAVAVLLVGLHVAELQIIQNNHVALAFALQHTRRRAHPVHARHRMVVHVDSSTRKPVAALLTCSTSRRELSAAQVAGIDIR